MPSQREQDAQRHVDKALSAAGADFAAKVERRFDGYSVTFYKPGRLIHRASIEERVLEDDPSPRLERLIEDVRREMDAEGKA